MIRALGVLGVIAVAAGAVWLRSERGEPAPRTRAKLLQPVESLASQIEKRRADVVASLDRLDAARQSLAEARLRAQVRGEMKEREVARLEKELEQTARSLRQLREHLARGEAELVLAGRTRSWEELDRMARQVLSEQRRLEEERQGQGQLRAALAEMAGELGKREKALAEQLALLRGQLGRIDTRIAEVKALEEAARAAGEADLALEESLRRTAREIQDLYVTVETERRLKQAEWLELSRLEDRAPGAPVAEIDAALRARP